MKLQAIFLLNMLMTFSMISHVHGQSYPRANDAVIINEEGKLVWESDASEASFFGVNYSAPFAYGYRAIQRKNVDIKEAIRTDVYHMARLGFTAFRVHVWDTEISDIEGNLLDNEHVQLFDFLLAELKKRNIRAILTPIAFWGNGYPEQDFETPGFSHFYGRSKLTVDPQAIAAQENYLRQFLNHINPYTGIAYKDDPYIIGIEINNEPVHYGSNQEVTKYIDTLLDAVRSTGFSKPVFYNIAQNPHYAEAVVDSKVDGFSFQWYPSGLVSGNTMEENYLHHIHNYTIPFRNLPSFKGRPLMVYEFDAADIYAPYMYPAMARSFRSAGFQWATQFAYDPLPIANNNTDYQTHYLNLVYTPQKAISMRIAAKVFEELEMGADWGPYPQSNVFGHARVSFEHQTSEYNAEREFYYTSTTQTQAVAPGKLHHIAGFGSSHLVTYEGLGAYFLDEIQDGIWRLEIYPDAVQVRDPFAPTSPDREVTVLAWKTHAMEITLSQLGPEFQVIPLNEGNDYRTSAKAHAFSIQPGTYALVRKGINASLEEQQWLENLELKAFAAPRKESNQRYIYHTPSSSHVLTADYTVKATVFTDETSRILLTYEDKYGVKKQKHLQQTSLYGYEGKIPLDDMPVGDFSYSIAVENSTQNLANTITPDDLLYSIQIVAQNSTITLFDAAKPSIYHTQPNYDPVLKLGFADVERESAELLQMNITNPSSFSKLGFQTSILDVLRSRVNYDELIKNLMVEAHIQGKENQPVTIGLTDADGRVWSAEISLTDQNQIIKVPISELKPAHALLLPRPYPEFLPLHANPSDCMSCRLDWGKIEKLEIIIDQTTGEMETQGSYQVNLRKVWLDY